MPWRPGGGVAVVTGGTAGVGRAVVRRLAADGYDVAVLARGRAGLAGAVADVEAAGRRGLARAVDVSDARAVDEGADRVERELGPVTVWVNAAFAGFLAPFWEVSPEEFRRVTDVTYHGQVNGTRAALRLMRPRDRGVIVNVGSAMAERSIPLQSAYCGAKHAIKGFSEAVITELKHERSRVRLCMLQLPGLNTPPVHLGSQQDAPAPLPGAARVPAGNRRPRRRRPRPPSPAQRLVRAAHRIHDPRQPAGSPGG